jgi:hypothetical protein
VSSELRVEISTLSLLLAELRVELPESLSQLSILLNESIVVLSIPLDDELIDD